LSLDTSLHHEQASCKQLKKIELQISLSQQSLNFRNIRRSQIWRCGCSIRLEGILLGIGMAGNNTLHTSSGTDDRVLPPGDVIFGGTPAMKAIRHQLEKICDADIPVLIQGGGGSGKEILARWIHSRSPWKSGRFVKANFAAIRGSLLEIELLGNQADGFTGAVSPNPGRAEIAKYGSLFFDEVAELDLALQAELLHLMQDGRFTRPGDLQERQLTARVICSTGRDLAQEASAGRFRPELFYRINGLHVKMPTLRERREDIPILVEYFLSQFALRFERRVTPISSQTMHYLRQREWLGNIRELENCVARYVLLQSEDAFLAEHPEDKRRNTLVPKTVGAAVPLKRVARQAIRELERNLILKALQENRWNRRKAAQALNISYRSLIYKIREAGLPGKSFRSSKLRPNTGASEPTPDGETGQDTRTTSSEPSGR
jgi:two-component system response regulator AtoC